MTKAQKFTFLYIVLVGAFYIYLAWTLSCEFDEAYTVSMISHSFKEIIDITSMDVHSPMYYFIVKIFANLLPIDSIYSAKLFSAICAIGFLGVLNTALPKYLGERTTVLTVFISSIAPAMITQVGNARMYTLGLLLVTCTILAGFKIYFLPDDQSSDMKKKNDLPYFTGFTVLAILTMYEHAICTTMVMFIYIFFFIKLILHRRFAKALKFMASGIIAGVSFIPWLSIMLTQFNDRTSVEGGLMYPLSDHEFYMEILRSWKSSIFAGDMRDDGWGVRFGMLILFLSCIVVFIQAVTKAISEKKENTPLRDESIISENKSAVVLELLFILPATYIFIGVPLLMFTGQFYGRYGFPLFVTIWLCEALAISILIEKTKAFCGRLSDAGKKNKRIMVRSITGLAGFIVISGMVIFGVRAYRDFYKYHDDRGLEILRETVPAELESNERIMFGDHWSAILSIYREPESYMIYGYKIPGLPFNLDETFTGWDQLDGINTVWLISNDIIEAPKLSPVFEAEDGISFSINRYEFTVRRWERVSE